MLGEYKVNRCTRQCYAQRRPLRDGEWYYSVVLEADEDYIRRDYSADSWEGPPEGAIGWWKNRMPAADEKKLVLAPPEVLIDLLRQMGEFPAKEKCRYLLALMLMRRRIVRPAKTLQETSESAETEKEDESSVDPDSPPPSVPRELLRVEVVADGSVIEVPICAITRSESDAVKEELDELLYCEAEVDTDVESE